MKLFNIERCLAQNDGKCLYGVRRVIISNVIQKIDRSHQAPNGFHEECYLGYFTDIPELCAEWFPISKLQNIPSTTGIWINVWRDSYDYIGWDNEEQAYTSKEGALQGRSEMKTLGEDLEFIGEPILIYESED